MAVEEGLVTRTIEADADLSTHQFKFVKLSSDGQAAVCDTQGEQAYGVLLNDPDAAGRAATIAVGGRCKVEAGGSISIGDNVTTQADGQAETASTGDVILGIARTSTSAAGEICSVELTIPSHGTA